MSSQSDSPLQNYIPQEVASDKSESHKKYLYERYSQLLKSMYDGTLSADELAKLLTQERLKLEEFSDHDGLINSFFNMKGFWGSVDRMINTFERMPELTGTVILIDVSQLERFNESWGHDIGDELLQLYAKIIEEQTRDGDIKGRIASDIFGIFLMGSGIKNGELVANRIKTLILEEIAKNFATQNWQYFVSIALSEIKKDEKVDALIDRVYSGFETAKQQKNSVIII